VSGVGWDGAKSNIIVTSCDPNHVTADR
jgi:hypothetical protein